MPEIETRLTATELELMTILWEIKEGSVRDIMGQLPADRQLAYTSVSTIVRILEKKNFVLARKEGRGHVYYPAIKKSEYEKFSVSDLIENVFDGTPTSLVRCLIEDDKLSKSDIDQLKKLIEGMDS